MRQYLQALACISAMAAPVFSAALPGNEFLPSLVPAYRPIQARQDACSNGPWSGPLEIGGQGTHYCECKIRNGELITGLEVWSDSDGITGILFTYSGGEADMQGYQTGSSQSLTLAPGELVINAALWGDGTGDHLGHIYLKTDKQDFDVGMSKPNNGYQIDVGGGLLLGAYGTIGSSHVGSIGWLFSAAKIDTISIGNIEFGTDPTGTSTDIQPSYLLKSTMGNPSGNEGNTTFTISASETVTQSTTWDQSTTGTFGTSASITVDAAPLGIGGSVTAGYSWDVSHTTDTSTSTSDAVTLAQTAGPISIAPGHGKMCTIVCQKGDGSFPYTSTVTVKFIGGASFSYTEKGTLQSVQFSEVDASCVDEDDSSQWTSTTDDPPAGFKIVSKNNQPAPSSSTSAPGEPAASAFGGVVSSIPYPSAIATSSAPAFGGIVSSIPDASVL